MRYKDVRLPWSILFLAFILCALLLPSYLFWKNGEGDQAKMLFDTSAAMLKLNLMTFDPDPDVRPRVQLPCGTNIACSKEEAYKPDILERMNEFYADLIAYKQIEGARLYFAHGSKDFTEVDGIHTVYIEWLETATYPLGMALYVDGEEVCRYDIFADFSKFEKEAYFKYPRRFNKFYVKLVLNMDGPPSCRRIEIDHPSLLPLLPIFEISLNQDLGDATISISHCDEDGVPSNKIPIHFYDTVFAESN